MSKTRHSTLRNLCTLTAILSLATAACFTTTTASADDTPSPLLNYKIGVHTHFCHKTPWMKSWDAEKHIPMIASLGVGWIRGEITWRDTELSRGQYRVSENTRKWIELANANGLKVLLVFQGKNDLYEDAYDPAAYARAAAWLARELDGKIHTMEIINEPFGSYARHYLGKKSDWTGREPDGSDSPWLARYVKLLNTAADAIKAANPHMPVVGLGNVTPQNYRQIAMGISRSVDGITDHPYSFRSPAEVLSHRGTDGYRKKIGFTVADIDGSFASFVRMYREHLRKHNGPSQIWFTEFGWTTFREGEKKGKFIYSSFSEDAQACYILRRFMEGLALGVEVSIQYAFKDDLRNGGSPFEAENGFGLIRSDGSLKPSYHAVRNLARATLGFVPSDKINVTVKPFSDRTDDHPPVWDGEPLPALSAIRHYPFVDPQGRTVVAIWSAERINDKNTRSADVEIQVDPAAHTLSVHDLLTGTTTPLAHRSSSSGDLLIEQLAVPPHPLLITINPRISGK